MIIIHRASLVLACAGVLLSAPAHAQKPGEEGLYELAAVEAMPRPLNASALEAIMEASYPAAQRAAGVGGRVTVRMVVGTDGVPGEAEVVASTDPAFNAPTLQAVKQLRFSPALVRRRPVRVWVQVPILWQTLPDDAPAAPSAAPPATHD